MTVAGTLPPRFCNDDEGTFCQYTISVRWPIIVQDAVDDVTKELDSLTASDIAGKKEIIEEGENVRERLIALRKEILDGTPLSTFTSSECELASVPGSFNEYLASFPERPTWHNAEWLFSETYLYRRINVIFRTQTSKHWKDYDVFQRLKQSSFKASYYGVVELAMRYKALSADLRKVDKTVEDDRHALRILFEEFLDTSLWGNATDLSLLTMLSLEELKTIQGSAVRMASKSKIVVNDLDKTWNALISQDPKKNVRVDFVLDNAGFELYTDLIFAAFLLGSKLAHKCVFHGKDIPYMVSDVTERDFNLILENISDREFFSAAKGNAEESQALDLFVSDIKDYIKTGAISFECDPFWTTDLDFWSIDPSERKYHGGEVYQDLLSSDLVIFKGDLNYRKLTGDRTWPRTTSWEDAIGPLAASGLTLVSLRTCKADVQVALPEGLDEKLCSEWGKDHPGRGSWWCSSGKWAVICFADSKKH